MTQSLLPEPTRSGGYDLWTPISAVESVMIDQSRAAGNYARGGNILGQVASGGAGDFFFPVVLRAADWAVTGKTPKLKIRMLTWTNATAPAVNFTGGLSLVSAHAGGTNAMSITFDAQVAASQVTRATPAASQPFLVDEHPDPGFAFPADGAYLLTVTNSGTTAAASRVNVMLQLLLKHV